MFQDYNIIKKAGKNLFETIVHFTTFSCVESYA